MGINQSSSSSLLCRVVIVEELQQQVAQSSSQREEMIRLKQELQLLHRDLVLSGSLRYTLSVLECTDPCFSVYLIHNYFSYLNIITLCLVGK